jgi:hypothetical protein
VKSGAKSRLTRPEDSFPIDSILGQLLPGRGHKCTAVVGGGTDTAAPGMSGLPEPTLCLAQAGPTCPPGTNPSPQEIAGPDGIHLPQGGHVDVAGGGRVIR